MKFQISLHHLLPSGFFKQFALGLFISLPFISFAQNSNPSRQERALMHREVPDQPYVAGSSSKKTSPAYTRESSVFFMTQVNVDANGQNILNDAANEPSIAVDPTNPNRMVIGWRQFDNINNNFRQAGYGYTLDGGTTWTFPGVIDPGIFRSDPVLGVDIHGNFYYNSLTSDANDNMSCRVYRIEDGGVVWDGGIYAQGGDKQWMCIDNTNGMGSGNNYSFWTSYWSICYPGAYTRSTDWGDTYESCSEVLGDPSWGTLAVGPDGELYIAGAGYENDPVIITKSTTVQNPDLPVSWDFTTGVDLDGYITSQVDVNPVGLLGQVWVDVDISEGPGRGNVYVLAAAQRISISDPGDIMFAKSTDGGMSWGAPKRLNNDLGANSTQWFGTMSLSPDGRIDVIWLDTRNSTEANPNLSALYYTYSMDQGETWSTNEMLSETFDPHVGWPQQQKMGDYFDMVSDNQGAHLAWAGTFNGEQDVYYGHIIPQIVGVSETQANQFQLNASVYPNPSKGSSVIRYDLSANTHVKVSVYDIYGQEVIRLVDEDQISGFHKIDLEAGDLAEGVYFCRINAGNHSEMLRIELIK
jgi:hypothetical protein